ncbi:MAG TPA: VWA domain-containing protein, partial [Pirellulales bacterium]|nr:VWA domain-containing protein [Pirellulales bacterium]
MNLFPSLFSEAVNSFAGAAGRVASATDPNSRVTYEWTRFQSFTEWWQKPLLVLVCLLIAAFVFWMYRRDSVELKPGVGPLLLLLRIATYGGLLLFFLGLEKRTEKKVTHNSRAILLVDTSLSMSRRDAAGSASDPQTTRIDQVVNELASTDLLKDLRKTQDVSVFRFDQETQKIRSYGKLVDPIAATQPAYENFDSIREEIQPFKWAALIGSAVFLLSVVSLIIQRLSTGGFSRPWLSGGLIGLSLLVALVSLARINISYPKANLWAMLGFTDEQNEAAAPEKNVENKPNIEPEKPVDWAVELQPHGTETRLGQALQQLLNEERNTPLAGIVVYTDGGQNAGVDPKLAMDLAKETGIPIFTVGLGSDQPPINVRISRFEAPARVYPGDGFKMTGFLQGEGLAGRNVTVRLFSQPSGKSGKSNIWQAEGAAQIIALGKDGEEKPVMFDLPGSPETGRKTYQVRVEPPPGDSNPADDHQEADVDVVERKNKVLLVAGGPTREYQFLRTQLKRDKDTVVDVLLQSGGDGISQEANQILSDFPKSKEELFAYDTIVAFDPNWSAFDQTQIDLLEKWV